MAEKSKLVKKVWGTELWLENAPDYCLKILTLNPGFICSYHYHKRKKETFCVRQGAVYIRKQGRKTVLYPGDKIRILPNQKHEFATLEGVSIMLEVSTHHEDSDSYREKGKESRAINLKELRRSVGYKTK